MFHLTEKEKKKYARHLVLDQIGQGGQFQIKNGKVLVVGTGGLGSPVLYYLAAAGVGTLGLVDDDTVDVSNLQRQIIHSASDLGRAKTASAAEKINRLNPQVQLDVFQEKLTEENVYAILKGYGVVVDATDNFSARLVLNKACSKIGIPFVHGGVSGFYGQAMTVIPGKGPCLQCVYPEPMPEPASSLGVVGAVAGTIGTIQATEVLKIILGTGKLLMGRLLFYDALAMTMQEITVRTNPRCKICMPDRDRSFPF